MLRTERSPRAVLISSLYTFVNLIFTLALVGVGVVSFWRGSWVLMDEYIYPLADDIPEEPEPAPEPEPTQEVATSITSVGTEDDVQEEEIDPGSVSSSSDGISNFRKTTYLSIGLGVGLISLGHFLRPLLLLFAAGPRPEKDLENPQVLQPRFSFLGEFLDRIFTYCMAMGSVFFWRGIWYFWDEFILKDDRKASAWISHCFGVGLLLLCCSLRSMVAPPAFVVVDTPRLREPIYFEDYYAGSLFPLTWVVQRIFRRARG